MYVTNNQSELIDALIGDFNFERVLTESCTWDD